MSYYTPPKAKSMPIKFFRSFRCLIGWHERPYTIIGNDGCSAHARCTACGYTGMVDSQGCLF
ncbi:putative translation initiation factor 2 initiation factor [Caudoviricetes sp.]|nr:putative translation initiation factor 2 initiation factor [Caudoviricetes sp.]